MTYDTDMDGTENTLSAQQVSDLKIIIEFVHLYCREKHSGRERVAAELPQELTRANSTGVLLCSECSDLVQYGIQKRKKCPLDPKPTCRKCHVHCYSGEYRAKIREIMAFSGRRMILRGRLDYLWHYYF